MRTKVPVVSTSSTDGAMVSTSSTDAAMVSTSSTDAGDGVGAASARVAAYLRDLILHDVLKPGDRIRQEEVAERFGTSRLPVREALRMLEAEGLTEHEPNKGARVPRLSMHEVDVVYRMRERLEPLALTESVPRLTDDDHAHLEEIQEQIEANADLDRFLDLDREFHLGTYAGCHIDSLNAMVTRLWNSTQHYRRAYVAMGGPARMWVVNAEHRLLLDAVVRRDTTDAERFLEGHIRRTRIELSHHPAVFGETDG
jgi:DNA-binding GntR family transcriptional regulator